MSSRNYNKLYVHTNREEGSEKLLLGYQNDTKEIILLKDEETTFHIPFFTNPVLLMDSGFVVGFIKMNLATCSGWTVITIQDLL